MKFYPLDASRYLTDDEAVAEYMNAVLESGDSNLLLRALGEMARVRGMARWLATPASGGRASTRPWRRVPSPASTPS